LHNRYNNKNKAFNLVDYKNLDWAKLAADFKSLLSNKKKWREGLAGIEDIEDLEDLYLEKEGIVNKLKSLLGVEELELEFEITWGLAYKIFAKLIKRKEEKKGNISFVYYKERKNNLEFLSYFADLIEKEKEIEDVNNKKEAIIIENILKEKDKLLVYVDIEEKML